MPCGYVDIKTLHHDPDLTKEETDQIEDKMKAFYIEGIKKFLNAGVVKPMDIFYDTYNTLKEYHYKGLSFDFHPIGYNPDSDGEDFIAFITNGFLPETVEALYKYLQMPFDFLPWCISTENILAQAVILWRLTIGR